MIPEPRLQEQRPAGPALVMIEGGSVKELVSLPALPVSLEVSALSSIAVARAGHRARPQVSGVGPDTLPTWWEVLQSHVAKGVDT